MSPTNPKSKRSHNLFAYAVGNRVLNPDDCEPFAQFFKKEWDQEHICVKGIAYQVHASQEQFNTHLKEQERVKNLLVNLEQELLASGKEINPYGKLARCIENIQTTSKVQVIDTCELNSRIKCSLLK